MRKNIVWTGAAFAVCALLLATGAYAQESETEHVSRTVKLDPGGTLRLKNFSGHVTITAADRADVAIDAVRRATRDRLNRIKLDIHAEGHTLIVDANSHSDDWSSWFRTNNVVETDFDIKVPRRITLDVSVFSSPVTVTGVEGGSHVKTFSAPVQLDNVVGPVDAETFSGRVTIRARVWETNQAVDVKTFSGDVELHVPESARADVNFNSFSGKLSAGMPMTFREMRRRNMTARLGPEGGGGNLHFKTFSGNVRIDR